MKSNGLKRDVFIPETSAATLDRPDPEGESGVLRVQNGEWKITNIQFAPWTADTPYSLSLLGTKRLEELGVALANRDATVELTMERVERSPSDRVRASVFKGEPLEASVSGEALWLPIADYFSLVVTIAEVEASPKWLIERLLNGEIVRVGEVFIRKTPEAQRELSKSRL